MAARLSRARRNQLIPQARALAISGWSFRAIATELGVSHPTVCLWLANSPKVPGTTATVVPDRPAELVRARRRVRTAGDAGDWLADLGAFLDELLERAQDRNGTPTERRLAAQAGGELALLAFELTAELRELLETHR